MSNYEIITKKTSDGLLLTAHHKIEADWSDQTGWFDPTKVAEAVVLIGLGGIGSNLAFELISMGFRRFVLYDDDSVEPRNLASQKAYRPKDLYSPKTLALAHLLIEYGATHVLTRQRRVTTEDRFESSLVISGVDSMQSRSDIWEAVRQSPDVEYYIDGRLGGEIVQILVVEMPNSEWYTSRWLFPDSRATNNVTCTMRAAAYPATGLSTIICRHLSRWYRGLPICQFTQLDLATLEITTAGNIERKRK